jgi:hypothetical protein
LPTIPPGLPPGDELVDALEFDAGALGAERLRTADLDELSLDSEPSSGASAMPPARPGAAVPASVPDVDSDHTLAEPVDDLEEFEPLEIDPDMLEPADEDDDDMAVMAQAFAKPPPLPPGAGRPPPVPPTPRMASEADGDDDGDDDGSSKKRGFFSRIFNK